MNLTPGTRLGVYEVVVPIGAGGMGEVYRARDTRLDRTVAVKVLPPRFASGEMRDRFEREARVISSLNHPNICALYDVGSENGMSYLVMEYIEGQPLADKLSRGALPLDQVLRHAIDIADALAKAHAHGFVHRDLKPGNVMIARGGGAKLLDFGLARRAAEGAVVMPDAPTVQGAPLTAEGTILGTLQYMSPEQLEGGEIDARSDLFSFGAVLYEMVTGERAFSATSHASLITKIMREQPRPISELQPVTPKSLERLIVRCLQKEPERRWQCAGDLAAELRAIGEGTAEAASTTTAKRRSAVPWAVAAMLAILAAILGAALVRPKPAPAPAVRFLIPPPEPATLTSTSVLSSPIAVSPDGNVIAFAASRSGERTLWLRRIGDERSTAVENTRDAMAPFWSPDGKQVAFFANGTLNALEVATGSVHKICDITPGAGASGTWGREGTIVYSQLAANDGLFIVPASGGTPKQLPPAGNKFVHYPRFLSDSKRVLFCVITERGSELWIGDLEEWKPRKVADGMSHVDFVPPYVVFARDGALVAQRFDEDSVQFIGKPVPIAANVYLYRPTAHSAHGAGGHTVAWTPFPAQTRIAAFDRSGAEVEMVAPANDYSATRISPDGKQLVTALLDRTTGLSQLWVVDRARKTSTRVSYANSDYDYPIWSPDGKRLVYAMDVDGPNHLYMKSLGDDKDEMLLPPGAIQMPSDWAGDKIIFSENLGATRSDIRILSLPGRKVTTWQATPFNEWQARLSPDGRRLAFLSDVTDRQELYLAPFDRSSPAVRISAGGTSSLAPSWRADGREVFYVSGRDVMAVPIDPASGSAGEPVRLFTARSDIRAFETLPDGQRVLLTLENENTQFLNAVVNWQQLVEQN